MSRDEIAALAGLPYAEAAFRVMRPFVGDAFTDAEFRAILARAYAGFRHPAVAPLRQLGPNDWLLELFHGPTLAFKDVAMQLIGQLFEASLKRVRPAHHHRRRHLAATPARRRSRPSAAARASRSSSSSPTAASPRCSAGR